jgi:hypothetical protein
MKRYEFYFAPEGKHVDGFLADSLKSAKTMFYRANPMYRKAKGEIYWEVWEQST